MKDEQELIHRILQGEREAFAMIVQKYQTPLLNYVGRMVTDRDTALDLLQEIFLKIYTSLHQYKSTYPFRTWIFKIAYNHVIDYWRKRRIETQPLEEDQSGISLLNILPLQEESITKKYELQQWRNKIERALEKLSAPWRELFIWRYLNELSYEEIAEIKNLPLGTVKNRIFQAKEKLRLLLEEEQ